MIFSKKSIEDIIGKTIPSGEIRKIRKAAKVLVIDDQKFNYLDLIRDKYGFDIIQVEDIDQVPFVKDYSIVLCDIDGVGKLLGCRHGGDLIIEIKKSYPLKTVTAYTGHAFKPDFNKFYSVADNVLEKDIELQEWVEELDKLCRKVIDPVVQWRKARDFLFKNNIRTSVVSELEDKFVRNYETEKGLNDFSSSTLVSSLSGDARNVIVSLVANMATRLLISG